MGDWHRGLRGGNGRDDFNQSLAAHGRALKSMGPTTFVPGANRPQRPPPGRGEPPKAAAGATPENAKLVSRFPGFAGGNNATHTPAFPGPQQNPARGTIQTPPNLALTRNKRADGGPSPYAHAMPQDTSPGHDQTPGSPKGSVISLDLALVDTELDTEGDSVQVFVRIRPPNAEEERQGGGDAACVQQVGTRSITCNVPNRSPHTYTFDQILWQTPQTDMFDVAGVPMVENCMAGYNSSIFAYGQTGAGKTYTMLGMMSAIGDEPHDQRGLAPRVFEYLFQRISSEEDIKGRDTLRYSCRCSFLEIYNETITDLLNPSAHNLQIREDQRGCFVEALSEVHVQHADDVMALMRKGAENRHVGETRMNRESSRSHSVFTCIVEKSSKSCSDGVTSVIVSRLNLIDLAGSERIASGAMGGSQVQGNHFKEAVHINKSLTTLGRVIMELVEAQRTRGHCRHIPYRDSRLTFLLQDSLGGNAKTMIIANISPSTVCAHETSSTLQFVQRAKCIRNKAHVNMDYRGDVAMLQREIQRLNKELEDIRQNNIEAAFQEAANLRDQLSLAEKNVDDLEQRVAVLTAEGNKLRRERQRLEEKLTLARADSGLLQEIVNGLNSRINVVEQAMASQASATQQAEDVLQQLHAVEMAAINSQLAAVQSELSTAQGAQHAAQQQISQLQAALDTAQANCVSMGSEQAATRHQLQATEMALADLKAQLAAVEELKASEQEKGEALAEQLHEEQQKGAHLKVQLTESQAAYEQLTVQLTGSQAECAQVTEQLTNSKTECVQLTEQLISSKGECMHLTEQLATSHAECAQLTEQLAGSKAECAELVEQMAASKAENVQLEQQLQAEQAKAQQLADKLQAEHTKSEHLGTELEAANHGCGQLDNKLHETQQQLTQSRAAHEDVCKQLEHRQQEIITLQQQLEEQQAACRKLQEDLSAAQEAGRGLQEELSTAQAGNEKLQAQLNQETEEHAAAQATLCAVRAELEEVTERWEISERHAAELDSLLQQEQERVASLARELDTERSTAAEAAAVHESTLQQLQQDLGQGSTDLLTARQQHEQLTREHQDTVTQGMQLQTALDEEQAARGAAQAALEEQTQLHQRTAQHVADLQQELANETQTRTQVQEELASVQAQLLQAQAEGAQLQDGLSSKQVEATAAHEEITQLKANLQESQVKEASLTGELAGVSSQLAEQTAARQAAEQQLEDSRQHCSQLQQELESSQHSLEALNEEMETVVAGLREEKSTLLGVVEQQQAELVTLKADGAQAVQAHEAAVHQLQRALEAQEAQVTQLSKTLDDTKVQLVSIQQHLQERDNELTATKKELAQANKANVKLNNQLTSKEDKLRHVKQTAQESEVQAGLVQKEQQERISYLQREIIRSQEQLVSREFELKSQVTKLSNQLEAARTEHTSLVRQLDSRTSELQAARTTLAGSQDTLSTTQAALADIQRELAEVRRRASDDRDASHQLQAKQQATISELCQELMAARSGAEQQIKSFVVRDTRQNRAFQEIRRLIEWATTPPSSGRSSVGPQQVDPLMVALALPEAGGSSPLGAAGANGRGQPPTPTAKLSPLPEESPETLRNSAKVHIAALYRLRSSLSLAMANENNQDAPGSPTQSTSPGMTSPKPAAFKSRCTTHSPRSSLAAELLRASVDAGLPKAPRAASSRQAAAHEAAGADDMDDLCSPRMLLESRDQSLTMHAAAM